MNRKAVEYAKELIINQGKENALSIAKECEKYGGGQGITFFDEADYIVNERGTLEYSKHQSGKNDGNKVRRIRRTKGFWRDVVVAITKGQK